MIPFFKPELKPLSSLLTWISYLKSRRWGAQMLVRLSNNERIFFRQIIFFLVGMIIRYRLK